jgi:hypothetical protein
MRKWYLVKEGNVVKAQIEQKTLNQALSVARRDISGQEINLLKLENEILNVIPKRKTKMNLYVI